jgi:hypothetical protein
MRIPIFVGCERDHRTPDCTLRFQGKFSKHIPRSALIATIATLVVCSNSCGVSGFALHLTVTRQSQNAVSIQNSRCFPFKSSQLAPRSFTETRRGLFTLRADSESKAVDENRTDKFSVKIVGACVVRDGSILMVERRQRSRGYWEFPGMPNA